MDVYTWQDTLLSCVAVACSGISSVLGEWRSMERNGKKMEK